jgi:hypothetical protein
MREEKGGRERERKGEKGREREKERERGSEGMWSEISSLGR